MKYDNITRATFIKRPNRFIAEVDLGGHKEIVYVKNTGRCKALDDAKKAGVEVLFLTCHVEPDELVITCGDWIDRGLIAAKH